MDCGGDAFLFFFFLFFLFLLLAVFRVSLLNTRQGRTKARLTVRSELPAVAEAL